MGTFTVEGGGFEEEFSPTGVGFEVDGNEAKMSVEKGKITGTVILERTDTDDPCCFSKWKLSLAVELGFEVTLDVGEFDMTETAKKLGVDLCVAAWSPPNEVKLQFCRQS